MKTEKRLSVVVPGFNTCRAWWVRCVASIGRILSPDDELILVDDCSDVPVIGSWFRDVKCVVEPKIVRHTRNQGLSDARNTGLKIAQGKYIAFVDSDDCVEAGAFDLSIKRLDDAHADIALFGVRTVWPDEGLFKEDIPRPDLSGVLSPSEVKELVDGCLFNYAWNKVYRCDFLLRHHLSFDPVGMPCEDVIFNLECVMAGAKWCVVDAVGYVYYRTGLTLLSRYKPSNFAGLHHVDDAWKRYKRSTPGAREVLGDFGEVSEVDIVAAERRNRLKPGSPYWFSKPYNLLRNLLYIRPVRRWHLRRAFTSAMDVRQGLDG